MFVVIPITAGMESKANITSVVAIERKAIALMENFFSRIKRMILVSSHSSSPSSRTI